MAWRHRTVAVEWRILELSGARLSQKEIAKVLDVSPWTVHAVQRKYHWVSLLGRHHVARRRYAYDEHAWGRVLEELYVRQRLGQHEVAARCGVDVGTVRRRLDDLGFGRRSGGDTRRGRSRGRYELNLPECATEGCTTRVREPDRHAHCAGCRRRMARRAAAVA